MTYTQCKYCHSSDARSEYFNVDSNVVLCHACAENIMEVVHKARFGKYLVRENPKQEAATYKKKHISAKLKIQVHEKYGYRCVSCGSHKDLTCDHIKPEILGGETTIDNLQTMCKSCNSSKGIKYEQ